MMRTAAVLARITHDVTHATRPDIATDQLNGLLSTLGKLHDGVEAVRVEEERILNNRNLSDDGKRKAVAELAMRETGKFKWLGRAAQEADSAHTRLTTLLLAPITTRPTGDPLVIFSREKEIRDAIRSFDSRQRIAHFFKALEQDDLETVRAMLDAPGGPMVSEEVRHRGEDAYAKRTNPEGYRKMKSVAHLQEHLGSLAQQVAMWLVSLGATPDAVKEAA